MQAQEHMSAKKLVAGSIGVPQRVALETTATADTIVHIFHRTVVILVGHAIALLHAHVSRIVRWVSQTAISRPLRVLALEATVIVQNTAPQRELHFVVGSPITVMTVQVIRIVVAERIVHIPASLVATLPISAL